MSSDANDPERLKQQIAQLEESYRRLVESVSEGVTVISLEGIITSVSPAIERLTGWSKDELLGSQFRTLIHPADLPLAIEGMQRLRNGEHLPPVKIRLLDKSGEYRPVEIFSQPEIEGGNITGVWTLTRDLTKDEQLARQSEELTQEKRRVQSLMDLIHATSLRLRTPLTLISLRASRLSAQVTDPAVHSSVEHIERYVQQLAYLIERVLTMAELDADRVHFSFEPVQLNLLVGYMQTYIQPLADAKKIAITVQPTPDLPRVRADQYQLYRAIQEVVENALEYTPESGSVTLSTFQRDSYGVIEVQDTGVGIAPERLPHLFERFYHFSLTTSAPDKLGLGLPIAKKIIDKHGGMIDVVSTPGKGSVFTIAIPLYVP